VDSQVVIEDFSLTYSELSLSDINILLLLQSHGCFREVGRILGVSQSLVSYKLKKVEKLVGKDLFIRSKHGSATVTESGARFLKGASEAMRLISHSLDEPTKPGISPPLVISSGEGAALTFLPRLINHFEVLNHESITLEVRNNLFTLEKILNGEADLGFISYYRFKELGRKLDSLILKEVCRENIIAISPRKWRINVEEGFALKDILEYPFVGHGPGSGMVAFLKSVCKQRGYTFPKLKYMFENTSSVISAVSLGLGVSCVFESQALPLLKAKLISGHRIIPPLQAKMYVATRRVPKNRLVKSFVKFTLERLKERHGEYGLPQ
jgi:DNA-binding transcriptional LysR family regulator